MVKDAQILEVFQISDGLDEACESLIALANEAGGSDNITAVAVRIEADPSGEPATAEPRPPGAAPIGSAAPTTPAPAPSAGPDSVPLTGPDISVSLAVDELLSYLDGAPESDGLATEPRCAECGSSFPEGDAFCGNCGARIPP